MSSTNNLSIAIVGSGSRFALSLVRAVFQSSNAENIHFRLMDIDSAASTRLEELIVALNKRCGKNHSVSIHSMAREAVQGADHVLCAFAVDFPASFLRTCWVLKDHGIDFVEGETATPGALMALMRHLPPLLDIARAAQDSNSEVWVHVINNPMPRLVMALDSALNFRRVVGHCHGTLHLKDSMAGLLKLPTAELDIHVAGINHFHIVQKLLHKPTNTDLLNHIKTNISDSEREEWSSTDFTQYKMFEELGEVIGHGIWHNYDYLPYANGRMWKHSHFNTWPRDATGVLAVRQASAGKPTPATDPAHFIADEEQEQIFDIILALSGKSEPYHYLSGNTRNEGRLPFLPDDAIVELPAWVSDKGIALTSPIAEVPLFFQQWLSTQVAIHKLSVEGALGSRRAAIESIALDPSFRSSNCSPGTLLDDMIEVNAGLVPAL
ncbi:hypothetical protein PSQ19_16145 [Devosia algicola]|uniref:Glycosyl hydrolase family 4 C-terminal domain-containing protein n=1 Tax=Devosia algicola TaxID=3026418 RepID=A0ABY7YLI5_9HYPH|nr:hypothetical protein [Devosia algicola]WDR02166.1 hypothetical protein PSQ19_16145 [Devosia algicola]